ncbi:MAG: FtsQ-type POTRA domain-containing protein [Rhodospirillaceae bacterium]|nr:FtsQ-type POTRA domain-containing protein [Rhodospirillaceae bacterium]MYJ72649.1 FtsQ-type POTRA domain-containing protein [Rhodospirillaceae bacterium]
MRRLNIAATSRRARKLEDCAALSAGAIIARAASTMPEDAPGEDARAAPALLPHTAPVPPADPPVRRNRRARRRPLRLIGVELRAHWTMAARLVLLIGLFGFPVWLWQTGRTESAIALIDRSAGKTAETLRSALALRLDHIFVAGRHRTSRRALLSVIGLTRGDSLTEIDISALRGRLRALPWVEDAVIERRWPNALYVRLHEHSAIARFEVGGRMKLISRTGAIVDMAAEGNHGNKLLVKGHGAPERTATLVALLQTRPVLAKRIVLATRQGRRRWDLRFDNGVFLKLPERRPDAAWHRFADLDRAHNLLAKGALGFDMRSRFEFVIRKPEPKDGAEETPGATRRAATRNGGRG